MELKLDCKNCKEKPCCVKHEGVFLTPPEAYWMRLKFGNKLHITTRYNPKNQYISDFLEFDGKPCPFLTNTLHCSIYNTRPRVCYWYPVDFRELEKGRITLMGSCTWVNDNRDKIQELMDRIEGPDEPTKEPDRRKYRLKVDMVCEIFNFSRDIPRGNKYAKEEIKIW